jgi:hypothetical protein
MNRRNCAVWVVAALLLVVSFRPAAGAQCFQQGGQYWNNTSNTNQDPSIPRAMFGKIWRPEGSTPYLAVAMGGKNLNLYDLTNPVLTTQPTVTTDLWRGFMQTIKTYPFGFVSTVDGSNIGYASLSVNGYVVNTGSNWACLKVAFLVIVFEIVFMSSRAIPSRWAKSFSKMLGASGFRRSHADRSRSRPAPATRRARHPPPAQSSATWFTTIEQTIAEIPSYSNCIAPLQNTVLPVSAHRPTASSICPIAA